VALLTGRPCAAEWEPFTPARFMPELAAGKVAR